MIAIIDYGLGNIRSVSGILAKLDAEHEVTDAVEMLDEADKLILPGVGAFGDGMDKLEERNLIAPLSRLVNEEGKPILGICLGAQLMTRRSAEFGPREGLGWVAATVEPLDEIISLRIPHVGWNDLNQVSESPLLDGVPSDAVFYYDHSFYIEPLDDGITTGETEYGTEFPVSYQQENIHGVQFHPEKSQIDGLRLMENFLKRC